VGLLRLPHCSGGALCLRGAYVLHWLENGLVVLVVTMLLADVLVQKREDGGVRRGKLWPRTASRMFQSLAEDQYFTIGVCAALYFLVFLGYLGLYVVGDFIIDVEVDQYAADQQDRIQRLQQRLRGAFERSTPSSTAPPSPHGPATVGFSPRKVSRASTAYAAGFGGRRRTDQRQTSRKASSLISRDDPHESPPAHPSPPLPDEKAKDGPSQV